MKVASAKAKGRRLQDYVRAAFLFIDQTIHAGDIKTAIMSESGRDIAFFGKARDAFPYSVECKNQESLSIWKAFEQAEKGCNGEAKYPLLVFKRNRSKTLAVVEFSHLLSLIKLASKYGVRDITDKQIKEFKAYIEDCERKSRAAAKEQVQKTPDEQ